MHTVLRINGRRAIVLAATVVLAVAVVLVTVLMVRPAAGTRRAEATAGHGAAGSPVAVHGAPDAPAHASPPVRTAAPSPAATAVPSPAATARAVHTGPTPAGTAHASVPSSPTVAPTSLRPPPAHRSPARPVAPARHTPAPAAAPLRVRAQLAAGSVAAGSPVVVTVRWSDGAGSFLGGGESWGSGPAVSSRRYERCAAGAAAAPASGSYRVQHVFDTPGSHVVTVSVATGGCGAVEQERSAQVTVTVLAPPRTDRPAASPSSGPARSDVPAAVVG